MRRVQAQQLNGRVGVEIERHIEQTGHKTLHAQGRATALLDKLLHSRALVLEALALLTHLDDPPHDLDLHPDHHVERLGIGNGVYIRDLPYLDAPKDDWRP